jgi:hypothetical protein
MPPNTTDQPDVADAGVPRPTVQPPSAGVPSNAAGQVIGSSTVAAESALVRLVEALARQAAREDIAKAAAASITAEHNPRTNKTSTVTGQGCP